MENMEVFDACTDGLLFFVFELLWSLLSLLFPGEQEQHEEAAAAAIVVVIVIVVVSCEDDTFQCVGEANKRDNVDDVDKNGSLLL